MHQDGTLRFYIYLYRSAVTIHTKHARPCTSMQAHAHRTDRHQRVYISMPYLSPTLYLAVLGTQGHCWYNIWIGSNKPDIIVAYTRITNTYLHHTGCTCTYSIQGPDISYVRMYAMYTHTVSNPDDESDLSRMRTATGHKKRLDDDSDLGHTRTATGHRKRSLNQTAAQREERLAAERLLHIPFFHIYHQLTERIFTLFAYPFFVITYLSNS